MFARNKEFLLETVALLKELQRQPVRKRSLALQIQERLLLGITRSERRVKANKHVVTTLKRELRRPGNDKAASRRIKQRLLRLRSAIEEQQKLIGFYRDIGDAIAFIYVDGFDLKPLSYKPRPGAITGKKGNRFERLVLRRAFQHGVVTVLNDLTNTIRHGDVTLIHHKYGLFRILELKSGGGGNRDRAERQTAAAESVMKYLATDVREGADGRHTIRMNLTCRLKYHFGAFNAVVRELRSGTQGLAVRQPEPGLTYIAVDPSGDVENVLTQLKLGTPSCFFFVNDAKAAGAAYHPFPLIFEEAEDLIAFYGGHFVVMVAVDFAKVAHSMGMQARYGKDDDWPFEFIVAGDAPERERVRPIGSHFVGRMAGELLSPKSVIRVATMEPDEETIALMNAQRERMELATAGGAVTSEWSN